MNKLLNIVTMMLIVFSLTACTSAQKKSRMVPSEPVEEINVGVSAVSNFEDKLLDENDEQELADLSNELDEDVNLEGLDELMDIEI